MRRSIPGIFPTLTAGAAVFALLGACGIPINHPHRPPYQRVRPIVVSLTGTWEAIPVGTQPFRPFVLSLRQRGASIEGSLHLPGGTLTTAWPGRIDRNGRFELVFGHTPDNVTLSLRIHPRPPRLSGSVADAAGAAPVRFVRKW